jgi:hypothetical protein
MTRDKETAEIISFPVGRCRARQMREKTKEPEARPQMDAFGTWYHEDALREVDSNRGR